MARRKYNEDHLSRNFRVSKLGTILDADGKFIQGGARCTGEELDRRGVNIPDCLANGYLLRTNEESDEQVDNAEIPGNPKPQAIKMDDEVETRRVGGGPSLEEVAKDAGHQVRRSIQDVDPSLLGDKSLDDLNAMSAERGHPGNFSEPEAAIEWLSQDYRG